MEGSGGAAAATSMQASPPAFRLLTRLISEGIEGSANIVIHVASNMTDNIQVVPYVLNCCSRT